MSERMYAAIPSSVAPQPDAMQFSPTKLCMSAGRHISCAAAVMLMGVLSRNRVISWTKEDGLYAGWRATLSIYMNKYKVVFVWCMLEEYDNA